MKVKPKRVKVSNRDEWLKFVELLGLDIENGTIGRPSSSMSRRRAAGIGGCEDACRDHGGVDLCGDHVALCGDGSAFIIEV